MSSSSVAVMCLLLLESQNLERFTDGVGSGLSVFFISSVLNSTYERSLGRHFKAAAFALLAQLSRVQILARDDFF